MTDNEKQFEDFVRQIKFDDTPDPDHRNKLEQNLLATIAKQTRQKQQPLKVWRTIMKTKIAKLATAAAIILVVALGITLLEKSVTPVWAIEDTAEALDQFNAIYISGTIAKGDLAEEDTVFTEDKRIPFEVWAQANEERIQSGNLRFEASGHVTVVNDMTTYTYDANTNTVHIQPGNQFMIRPWFTGDFLTKLEQMNEDLDLLYGKDAPSGRERVFVTLTYPPISRSYWIEIDLETKLPVCGKQWHNMRREGTPAYDVQRIVYFEELPDKLFEFEIPESAKVVDEREQFEQILRDPDYGLVVNGLTEEEACKKIVEEYWRAMINRNWQRAQKLRGLANETWEKWKAQYYDNMPVEVIEIKEPYPEKDWMTTPMTIKMADGRIKEGKLLVKFREIENVKSCLIVGNYGPRELNDIE